MQQEKMFELADKLKALRDQKDALEAEREILATGLGHEWSDVRAYFTRMAAFRAGRADASHWHYRSRR